MLRRSLLLSIPLFISHAFADILFIDLNNSPKEIEAAKKAAYARGEKVIVLTSSKKTPFIDDKNISSLLTDLKKKNVKLSSVVISGHDGNGEFHGAFGRVSEPALERAFKKINLSATK